MICTMMEQSNREVQRVNSFVAGYHAKGMSSELCVGHTKGRVIIVVKL